MANFDTEEVGGFPLSGINNMPLLYPNGEVAARVFHEILNKYCLNTEFKDVKLMIVTPLHMMQIFAKRSIQTQADFKNAKWRAAGKVEAWTVEALGGSPVEVGTGDVSGALDRGVIDGIFFTWSAGLAFGVKDVTKYRTEANLISKVMVIAMNKNTWNKLPADIQKQIDALCTPEVSQRYGANHDKLAANTRGAIVGADKAAGNPGIYVLPQSEKDAWAKTVAPVYDKWVKDAGGKAQSVLDDAKKLVTQYSAAK